MKRIYLILAIFPAVTLTFGQQATLYYGFDKSDLSDKNKIVLNNLMQNAGRNDEITIEGYADSTGSEEHNLMLSKMRTDEVSSFLREKGYQNLEVKYYGEEAINYSMGYHSHEYRKVAVSVNEIADAGQVSFLYKPLQVFDIDNSKDTILICREGTKIKIPREVFQKQSGEKVKTKSVQIKVSEYYQPSDMLLAGLTTTSDGQLLETGGMMYIEASTGNEDCVLIPGKKIQVSFNDPDTTKDIYYGRQNQDGTVNWKTEPGKNVHSEEDDEYIVGIAAERAKVTSQTGIAMDSYQVVEEMPEFNSGGTDVFNRYVMRRITYPAEAIEKGIEGRLVVSFIVDKQGNTKDIKVIRGLDPSIDSMVVKVINNSPKWTPGKVKNKPVDVMLTLPINFTLDAKSKKNTHFAKSFRKAYGTYPNDSSQVRKNKLFDEYSKGEVSDNLLKSGENGYQLNVTENFKDVFSLGWLNFDKRTVLANLVNMQLPNLETTDKVYRLLLKDYRIIIPAYHSGDHVIFRGIPNHSEAVLVGFRFDENVEAAKTEFTTAPQRKPNLEFKEMEMKELDSFLNDIY